MKKLLAILALMLIPLVQVYAQVRPLVPLYVTYKSGGSLGISDYFYTTSQYHVNTAITYGYVYAGIVGFVSCSPDPTRGGLASPVGPTGNEPYYQYNCPEYGSVPFYRFWNGGSYTDHFYTTNQSEINYVLSNGWTLEGVEAYLFQYQPGTVPLYRLNKWDGVTQDLVHFYTADINEFNQKYYSEGFWYDGVAGYIYPVYNTPQFTDSNYPTSLTLSKTGPNRTDSTALVRTSTNKPANATKQVLYMEFVSHGLFSTSEVEHVVIGLTTHTPVGSDGVIAPPFEGLGVILTSPGFGGAACPGGNIQVEAVLSGTTSLNYAPPGRKMAPNAVFPSTCLSSGPLFRDGVRYRLNMTVTTNAELQFDVYEYIEVPNQPAFSYWSLRHSSPLTSYGSYFSGNYWSAGCSWEKICTSSLKPGSVWDPRKTGFVLQPVGGYPASYTIDISNLSVTWQ